MRNLTVSLILALYATIALSSGKVNPNPPKGPIRSEENLSWKDGKEFCHKYGRKVVGIKMIFEMSRAIDLSGETYWSFDEELLGNIRQTTFNPLGIEGTYDTVYETKGTARVLCTAKGK